jgi:Na+/proline symporter
MHITWIDWVIVVASILICFVPALFLAKRSSGSTAEFFASGRSVPWWLAGLSMVATTFSSDTPNWVTEQVRKYGVAGNWQWWAFVLTGVATVFFFARLWRRSGVMTDLEFYEHRYSGTAASVVRGFRALYLGLFFNCFIMGMVTLAACKIANILFGMPAWQTIVICGALNIFFAQHSGLWGVLVIDMVQFFIKMTAVFAAAWFSLVEVGERLVGKGAGGWAGLKAMVAKLSTQQVVLPKVQKMVDGVAQVKDGIPVMVDGQPVMSVISGTGQPILDMLPNFTMTELSLMIFIVPIAIGWWANWYPGAEPGGGSYIAQRMLASKSEKDSLGGTLFFNIAHYVLRPWPWIITALCSIIIYPDLASIAAAFPDADKAMIGHDSAFPAMLMFLPVGFVGLMIGGLIAANSSTILTHLNWGSSYLVHDFYRRFIKKDASESHYINAGRLSTVLLYVVAAGLSYVLESAQSAFQVLISVGAGTGSLYIVRWYWHRVNAWAEVVAMVSSVAVTVMFLLCDKLGSGNGGLTLAAMGALMLMLGMVTDERYKPEFSARIIVGYALPFLPLAIVMIGSAPDAATMVMAFVALAFCIRRLFVSDVQGEPTMHTSLRLAGLLVIASGLVVKGLTDLTLAETLLGGGFAHRTLWTVGLTTLSWLAACFLAPATDRATLLAFYRKVKPAGPGWTDIRAAAGISDTEIAQENRIGSAFVGWIAGCVLIWASLFAIGNFLYSSGDPKRLTMAWVLTAVTAVSGYVLLKVTQQLWADSTASQEREDAKRV